MLILNLPTHPFNRNYHHSPYPLTFNDTLSSSRCQRTQDKQILRESVLIKFNRFFDFLFQLQPHVVHHSHSCHQIVFKLHHNISFYFPYDLLCSDQVPSRHYSISKLHCASNGMNTMTCSSVLSSLSSQADHGHTSAETR